MRENELVQRICEWVKKQGYKPEVNVTLGRGRRRIEVDVYFERGEGQLPIAIEAKTDKAGFFDGLGKALVYSTYTNCEVWLALPSESLVNLAKQLLPLPFHIFNAKNMILVKSEGKQEIKELVRYICPLCDETITFQKGKERFLNIHMRKAHRHHIWELREALKIYDAIKTDEVLKNRVNWLRSHSEEFDWNEAELPSDWKEEKW